MNIGVRMVDVFGIYDRIYSIIRESWKPQKDYSKEDDYRDDLIRFLRNALKPNMLDSTQHSIQKESGRGLADIGIDRGVGIELKLNLKGKAEANRLVGQVSDFLEDYREGVIIVLCGNTDSDKLDYLKNKFAKYSNANPLLGEKRVKIITKTYAPQNDSNSVFDFKLPI
jgi:hypothetical protein